MKKHAIALTLLTVVVLGVFGQSHLTVDIDDPVYTLIEMAEVRGLLTRVSQIRPFPLPQIQDYLDQLDRQRNRLSRGQERVLDEQLRRFGVGNGSDSPERERSWYESGRFEFGGEGTDMENFPMRIRAEVNNLLDADLSAGAFQNVTPAELYWEGDLGVNLSYSFHVGFGAYFSNPEAFAPFSHTSYSESFILAMNGGLHSALAYNGFGVSFHFEPEITAQFWDGAFRMGMGRYSRSMGLGTAGLTLSQNARPYDAIELAARPAQWFNFYFSVGSLGNWFSMYDWFQDYNNNTGISGDPPPYPSMPTFGTAIDEKNLTLQVLELMPWDWLYLNLTTGSVWGKRMELSYFNPLMPLLFAQNLYGDADNMAMEMSGSFNLPFGLKIYGSFFADEVQFNDLGTLFSKTSQQFALQAGIKGLIPGLGFTMGTLQYTKLEPYVYTHYEQVYPGSTALVNTNWTHDRYNLGYYLPPNSDEFQVRFDSLAFAGFKIYGSYRYIRHGYGDWNNGDEIEGTVTSGGAYPDSDYDGRHAYKNRLKDFLNDGPYEHIHMAMIGAEYQFPTVPVRIGLEYTFSYASNDGSQEDRSLGVVNAYSAYTPYDGISNNVSLFLRIYPEY